MTPLDEGCQQLMSQRLAACGFAIEPMHIEDVENFWAIRGNEGPVLCFAGHTDVVPTGPLQAWQNPPFSARIDEQGMLHGRGAADMKGSPPPWSWQWNASPLTIRTTRGRSPS